MTITVDIENGPVAGKSAFNADLFPNAHKMSPDQVSTVMKEIGLYDTSRLKRLRDVVAENMFSREEFENKYVKITLPEKPQPDGLGRIFI